MPGSATAPEAMEPDMNKGWGIIALVVAGLYWLQAVLIPLALAVLLTFLLSPVVSTLHRRGLGRVPSVLVTVLLALSILGGIGWTLTRQVVTLADELPRYSLNIRHRIADLRGASKGGSVEKVQKAVADVVGEIQKTDTPSVTPQKPLAVVLESSSILVHLPNLLHALAGAGVVTVLVIFMLLERLELRDRVILLIGYRRMTATTSALDEAGARISRYLLMQSLINGSFGVAVGLGLFLIGVPYAVTWGSLAAALRFIPYLGAFVAVAPAARHQSGGVPGVAPAGAGRRSVPRAGARHRLGDGAVVVRSKCRGIAGRAPDRVDLLGLALGPGGAADGDAPDGLPHRSRQAPARPGVPRRAHGRPAGHRGQGALLPAPARARPGRGDRHRRGLREHRRTGVGL